MTKIVLGIDALEYNLVEEFKLDELKQKAYTKLDLSDFPLVLSELIWPSMLTGHLDEEMISKVKMSTGALTQRNSPPFRFLRRILPLKTKRFLGKKVWGWLYKQIMGNPKEVISTYLREIGIQTILEEYGDKAWHNSIPGLGYPGLSEKEIDMLEKALEDPQARKAWTKHLKGKYEKRVQELRYALKEKNDFDLIFWYTHYPDYAGHAYGGRKLQMMSMYLDLNKLTSWIKKKLNQNDALYIISDHGMKPLGKYGVHSNHGFFSSNDGNLINKPQELYQLLKED